MKLSKIDITGKLTDDNIQKIVYSDIGDSGKSSYYGIVFGNNLLYKQRVNTAVEAYKKGRIKKIIFCGGTGGISNEDNEIIPEAIKMRDLAIRLGINEKGIIIEDKSNNTFENVENAFKLIDKSKMGCICIITSEFHIKRCKAIINNKYPDIDVVMIHSKDGFTDSDNWFLSDDSWNSGRSFATSEAKLLVTYAREGKIKDLEVINFI